MLAMPLRPTPAHLQRARALHPVPQQPKHVSFNARCTHAMADVKLTLLTIDSYTARPAHDG